MRKLRRIAVEARGDAGDASGGPPAILRPLARGVAGNMPEARRVRAIFDSIAPRYDRFNRHSTGIKAGAQELLRRLRRTE